MNRLVLLCVVLCSSPCWPHGGGLDSNGGHVNRKTDEYHCHREPCFRIQRQTQQATEEALAEKRPLSLLYQREDWKHWEDVDQDCMNTRHEILLRQSHGETKRSPDGCFISAGEWQDPYSGKTFTRASDLDIDHVVPLKWAHDHGGAQWTLRQKAAFANDERNLLAVDDGLNQAKGSQGPTEWLPPNHAFRCDYLKIWQSVLIHYPDLTMTSQESRVFKKQLSACN